MKLLIMQPNQFSVIVVPSRSQYCFCLPLRLDNAIVDGLCHYQLAIELDTKDFEVLSVWLAPRNYMHTLLSRVKSHLICFPPLVKCCLAPVAALQNFNIRRGRNELLECI